MARNFMDDYEPVESRIAKFWADHPTGRIHTLLVDAQPGEFIFRAEVYNDAADGTPFATGYAHEQRTEKGVNSTSACENCETSAIGRALANAGYAAKGSRPSREEMAKTQGPPPAPKERIANVTELVRSVNIEGWVKDQNFPWPWTEAVCEAIADEVHRVWTERNGESTPLDTPDLGEYSSEPF